ncbi:MAG: C-GCAxxG-C-C family protein [Syntrophorhabdaceae bacterium]|nr:C-GCAxxG-C-C family protein [Syntrophorhabdaceae bacterium]
MKVSRRELLKGVGALTVGAGLGGFSLAVANGVMAQDEKKVQTLPDLPWPYKKLDPVLAAEDGYAGYYKGACSYGVFESIVGQLRKEVGFPYTMVPTTLLVVGQGGMADTASLCGALTGAASAIFLVAGGLDPKKREVAYKIIQEVFLWYEQTALPDYKPNKPRFESIAKSVSNSTLCHVSISRWCKVSKFKAFSKERSDRCGWITAAVAKYTVEMLNKHADTTFKTIHTLSPESQKCRSCHDRGSVLENTRGIMDCGGCHFSPKKEHPKI